MSLKGELERNKKRDALMTGQLQELEQRSLTYERQQAQDVDIRSSTISGPVPDMEALGRAGRSPSTRRYRARVS